MEIEGFSENPDDYMGWSFGGVDPSDYPDMVDFYIESVTYKGRVLEEEELKVLHGAQPDFVYDQMVKQEIFEE